MTIQSSKKYGGILLFKVGILLLVIAELIYFFGESQGDFANGILFFLDSQANLYFLAFLILYFSTLCLFGRRAGHEIIIKKKKYLLTGIIFGVCSSVLITIYFLGFILLVNNSIDPEYNKQNQSEITRIFIQNFFIIMICMVSVWIWATNRLNQKGQKA